MTITELTKLNSIDNNISLQEKKYTIFYYKVLFFYEDIFHTDSSQ